MNGLPPFRTPAGAARAITWWSCLAGYFAILVGVPALAQAIHSLARFLFSGSGITQTAAGPALEIVETQIGTLARSFMVSWQGIPVSIPFVILARRYDMFGWATAAITGILVLFIVIGGVHGFGIEAVFFIPGSVVLGLAFWLTIRLIHPEAFHPRLSAA